MQDDSSLLPGRRLASPVLVADGNHARIDGFVSLGVVASAIVVALGAQIAHPLFLGLPLRQPLAAFATLARR